MKPRHVFGDSSVIDVKPHRQKNYLLKNSTRGPSDSGRKDSPLNLTTLFVREDFMQSDLKLVDERDLANRLSISVGKLRKDRLNQIGFPFVKIGRSIRYDINHVLNHLKSKTTNELK